MNRFFKVIAVLLIALTSTVVTANAQIFMYGVTAGANVSNYKLTDVTAGTEISSSQLGYQAGLWTGINLPLIDVTAEALWVHNKMAFADSDDASIVSNSVEIPVLAALSIFGPLQLKAGPSFMVYNDAKAKYADGEESLDGSVKSSLGYVIGLGLNISKIRFDVRYNGQFKKESAFGLENTVSDYDIQASTISASIAYKF